MKDRDLKQIEFGLKAFKSTLRFRFRDGSLCHQRRLHGTSQIERRGPLTWARAQRKGWIQCETQFLDAKLRLTVLGILTAQIYIIYTWLQTGSPHREHRPANGLRFEQVEMIARRLSRPFRPSFQATTDLQGG